MKFKMRIVFHSRSGSAETLALAIARDQKATADKIPPAYPIENEKLLFLLVEAKGASVDKAVVSFCKDLTTSRAKNVALLALGGKGVESLDEIKKIITSNGINVAGEPFHCKLGGLLKKSISESDLQAAVDWASKLVDSM